MLGLGFGVGWWWLGGPHVCEVSISVFGFVFGFLGVRFLLKGEMDVCLLVDGMEWVYVRYSTSRR